MTFLGSTYEWNILGGNTAILLPTFFDPAFPSERLNLDPYEIRFSARYTKGEICYVSGASEFLEKLPQTGATRGQLKLTLSASLTRTLSRYPSINGDLEFKLGNIEESWLKLKMIFSRSSNKDG